MRVTAVEESVIRNIGHAFGYYDYGAEHGLIDAFPSREAAAAFIRGYVRMALESGTLYSVGENGEGWIAYRLPGQRIPPRAMLPLARGLLGAMRPGELLRFTKIMSRGARGWRGSCAGRGSPTSPWASSACGSPTRVRDSCGRPCPWPSPRGTGWASR